MFIKITPLAALSLGFLLIPGTGLADETEDENETEEVTVISNRLPTNEAKIGSSVTVIEEDEIEASQKITLFDLLKTTPGVSVSRNGGLGTVATIRLRGAEASQTLVLINGVKLNDLSSPGGEFNFANLTLESVERVEILRGPQSTLYGSDAIGGVINIITKQPDQDFSISGFVEGGSFGTVRGGANLGVQHKNTTFSLDLGGTRSGGISAADSSAGNIEPDGFRTLAVSTRLTQKLHENFDLNFFFRHADSRADFDTFDFINSTFTDGDGVTDTTDRQISIGGTFRWLSGKAKTEARVTFSRLERHDMEFQAPSFDALSQNRTIDLLNTFEVVDGLRLLIGGQFQDNEIFTEVFGFFASTEQGSADISSVFAEAAADPFKNLTLTFGVRHDDHETFGGHTTFRVTGNWRLPKTGTTFRANWGEGFKAPSLFQLFSAFGDPTLQPETSQGWEFGVEQEFFKGGARLSVTYFQRRNNNLIDFSLITFTYANVLQTRAKGVEITFSAKITETFSVYGNYTYLKATNTQTGLLLSRRPKNTFNANFVFDATPRLQFSGGLNYVSSQVDGFTILSPYKVVDLRAAYDLNNKVTLFARIENAFDEQYQMVAGFGTPGVSAFGGIRGNF